MQEWIAGLLAVLGALLVLAGGAITTVKVATPPPGGETVPAAGRAGSLWARIRQLRDPDRLLLWGVILLILAAITAGAISFSVGASAGAGTP